VWLWLVFGSVAVTLYLYLGDPRIRVPFDPLVLVLATDAWVASVRGMRAWTFRMLAPSRRDPASALGAR
jgi:hypothetical protein